MAEFRKRLRITRRFPMWGESAAWFYHQNFEFIPRYVTGLVVWLDAADADTITASSGAVSEWRDKSQNDYHAAQATGSAQPMTGARTINSLNALDFDGNDFLATPDFIVSPPFTMFAVLSSDVADDLGYAVDSINATDRAYIATNVTGTGQWEISAGTALTDAAASYSSGVNYLVVATFNGGSSSIAVNGHVDASGAAGSNGLRGLTVGAAYDGVTSPWDGAVGEVLVYDRVLPMADAARVSLYLKDKWNLWDTLAAAGSFFNTQDILTSDGYTIETE